MDKIVNIYVNGYGTPKWPYLDGNLRRYLMEVRRYIKARPNVLFRLFLVGGYTNDPYLSEAHAMQNWFEHYKMVPENVIRVVLLEETTTARDNLAFYSTLVDRDKPSIFFYEYSRRFQMMFLIRQIFGRYHMFDEFHGVKFDARSMKLTNRLKQYFVKFPLEVLSWYFPFIQKHISAPLRKQHVERCGK